MEYGKHRIEKVCVSVWKNYMAITCQERIVSEDYVDLITDYRVSSEYNYDLPADYCYHQVEGDFGILYVEQAEVEKIGFVRNNYLYLPKCFGLMQEAVMLQTGGNNAIPYLESGITTTANEPLNLKGNGVVIGFIDTGIQYQREDFIDDLGRSRILAIWDQTIQTGVPPVGFEYGSEYTKEQIEEALRSENPLEIVPSNDVNGHGTAMASVAAGGRGRLSGTDRTPLGVATDCEIAVVKLKEAKQYYRNYYYIPDNTSCYQENDIILAIQYLQKFAKILVRPLVICLGIGTNQGDHTGNGMLGRYINNLSNIRSRVFVMAAGNEGNESHHYHGKITAINPVDTVEVRVGQNCKGFVMDFFGDIPYQYQLAVRSPAGEVVPLVRLSSESRGRVQRINYSFLYEGTRMEVDYFIVEPYSGAQFVRFRMENPAAGIWTFDVATQTEVMETNFDIWLPINGFTTSDVIFLRPDPDTTITTPGYAQSAITVSTYQTGSNSIWQDSGRGYGRNNLIKPDLAAPGVEIATTLGTRTGSSMAAAITAGAAAQLFQWLVVEKNEIFADANLIKSLLVRGAKRDRNITYPNEIWGYGRLDIAGIFAFLTGISI